MDSGFDQNQSKLGVHVLAVSLQVLAHGHGFLDQTVQIFRQSRRQTLTLQDAHDFGVGHRGHLRDAVVISQDDADLRRRHAFLRHLRDHVFDFIRGGFAPERRRSFERDGRFGHPFSFAVHATHVCKLVFCCFLEKKRKEEVSILLFVTGFLLQKTFAQHTVPKRSFLLGPKSRVRRLVVGVRKTPPHQETTITSETNTFTTIQKQSHPPVRIFASHQIKHTHPHRAAHFSLAQGKKRRWFSPRKRGKKKMKNLNERAAPKKNQTRTALSTAPSRVQFNLFSFARKRTDLKERENTHTRVSLLRVPFLNFFMKRDEEGFTRKEKGGVGFLFFSSFST